MSRPVDVSIVTSGHDVADARLHRLCGALLRRGLSVEVLGLGEASDGPDGVLLTTSPRPGFASRAVLAVRYSARARGRVLLTLDPDALVAARVVGTLRRRRVVADVHEDYARLVQDRDWPLGVTALGARVVVAAAMRAARTSALTLVSDDHVPPLQARERFILRNEADGHLVGGPGPHGDAPRACYVGDVRPSRGLFTMLEAVAASPPWTLDVVGPVRSSDRAEIDRRCSEPDLVGRVTWHGRQPPARAWSVVEGSWVGFALLDDTPAFRDALPSKVYEYLAKGILPVVSDLPRQAQLLREVGAGVVVRDAEDAASALRAYASDPQRRRAEMQAAVSWTRQREDASSAYDRAAARVEAVLARD